MAPSCFSSSSPLSFGLVTYDSDSSMEVEEPKKIAAGANSSLELPQQSSEDDDQSLGGRGGQLQWDSTRITRTTRINAYLT